jgi:hypothetical protein
LINPHDILLRGFGQDGHCSKPGSCRELFLIDSKDILQFVGLQHMQWGGKLPLTTAGGAERPLDSVLSQGARLILV